MISFVIDSDKLKGIDILRNAKAKGYGLFVVDMDATDPLVENVANLGTGFLTAKTNIPYPYNVWETLSALGSECLIYNKLDLPVDTKFVAEPVDLSPDKLVTTVDSIDRRVKYAQKLSSQKILFSSACMSGPPTLWAYLSGFAQMMLDVRIVEPAGSADLILNLFAANYPYIIRSV